MRWRGRATGLLVVGCLCAMAVACGGGAADTISESTRVDSASGSEDVGSENVRSEDPARCLEDVDGYERAVVPVPGADLLTDVFEERLADIPERGSAERELVQGGDFPDESWLFDYYDSVRFYDTEARRDALASAGFDFGLGAEFRAGDDRFNVVVLRFPTPEDAADYHDASTAEFCPHVGGMRSIPGVPGGVTFEIGPDGIGGTWSTLVIDRYEITLDICECAALDDLRSAAAAWAKAVFAQHVEPGDTSSA